MRLYEVYIVLGRFRSHEEYQNVMQCYIHEVIEYENETAKKSSLMEQRVLWKPGFSVARCAHDTLALHSENAPGMHRFVALSSEKKSAMMHEAWYRIFSHLHDALLLRIPKGNMSKPDLSRSEHSSLQQHPIERLSLDLATAHRRANVPPEAVSVGHEVVGGFLVQRVASVGLEEEELQADNDGVEVEHRLPVFAQDVEADVTLEVNVGVVDLLFALDFRRLVREVLADGEGEVELAAFVQALVGGDSEGEVEDVVGVLEGCLHGAGEGEFRKI